jgi:hypothetical protein
MTMFQSALRADIEHGEEEHMEQLTPQVVFMGIAAITGAGYALTAHRRRRHFSRAWQQADVRANATLRRR